MTKGWHWRYNKVHMATRWTIRHGLMPLWFKDLMNITEKLQFIDPTFRRSCLVPSSPDAMGMVLRSRATFSTSHSRFPARQTFFMFCTSTSHWLPSEISWLVPCDWFDFGFTTLNWTALQHQSRHDHPHPVSSLAPYDVFLLFVGCFRLIALNRKVL